MAFEREVITNIRYRVDAYDEQCLFDEARASPNTNESIVRSHIRLGSLDKAIHLGSYSKKLVSDIHLQDLQALLTTFLRLNHVFNTKDDAISYFQVCATCVCWESALTCVGGPLPCVAGYVQLSGDGNEEG